MSSETWKVIQLQDKILELEKQLDYSKMFHCPHFVTTDNGYIACNKGFNELEKVKKQNARYHEALEFYADIDSWNDDK